MRKTYVAPMIEFEEFQLDASIASNCAVVVTEGPDFGGRKACDDYLAHTGQDGVGFSLRSNYNINFYEGMCECYTTGSGGSYFTS